ncbi:MAG UNVERIFIED_CONTAM: phosphoenolpyruvate carboxylase [Anaerolineae bacterium]
MIASANLTTPQIDKAWHDLMDELAEEGRRAYRGLVYESEGFIEYWQQTTPIRELSHIPMSSRPAKRVASGFSAMRAIPWVFSWMQSRAIIPELVWGWGRLWQHSEQPTWRPCRSCMCSGISSAICYRTCNWIWSRRTWALPSSTPRLPSHPCVNASSTASVMSINWQARWSVRFSQQTTLMETASVLKTIIERRNPYVDPLNFIQVELLAQLRQLEEGTPEHTANAPRCLEHHQRDCCGHENDRIT